MTEPLLTFDKVDKTYDPDGRHPVRAVQALNMEVHRGEIVALLGSSGCGKTSTLRMVAGFESVTAGTIHLGGHPIHRLHPARRNVAMAFEGYSLYPPLTVRENIAFALKASRLTREDVARRVQTIAELLEIAEVLERRPSEISAGQQQRVSLARALVREAALHLLDEPMGQLEPRLRALLRGRLKHYIKERGLTAILVTHDQTEANALADRIAVMEGGILQQIATPETLKAAPANLFTGTFIGEPPMNVFAARTRAQDDRLWFDLADGVSLAYPGSAFAEPVRAAALERGEVSLGVRPHAVHLDESGPAAEVVTNQWLGDQSHIATRFAGDLLVTVTHDRQPLKRGESIGVAIRAADLHLFDSNTGQAISHGGRAA